MGSAPLIHNDNVLGMGSRKGTWFDFRLLWKQPEAGFHLLPHIPSQDDSRGGHKWLLLSGRSQAGFSTPGDEFWVSSWEDLVDNCHVGVHIMYHFCLFASL